MVIFNFRADRVVEISKALEMEKFDAFDRKRFPKVIPPLCLLSVLKALALLIPLCAWTACCRCLPIVGCHCICEWASLEPLAHALFHLGN